MAATSLPARPGSFDALIRPDRVHGSLYTDPAIYRGRARAHLVPDLGLRRARERGPRAERLRAQVDRPAAGHHDAATSRARSTCCSTAARTAPTWSATRQKGNSSAFRCPYHGWTFSNTGKLLGLPVQLAATAGRSRRRSSGSAASPRVASYHGFVFGSFADEGPTLRRAPGRGRRGRSTASCRLSPAGEVELTAGWLKHKVKANWKMLLENETDGYHPQFVHASIFSVADSGIGDLYGEKSDGGRAATSAAATPRTTCARSSAGSASRWAGSAPSPERVPGLRGRHAGGPRRGQGARDPHRRLAARDDLPQPVHRRDPDLRDPAARGRRDRAARDRRPVQGRRRT